MHDSPMFLSEETHTRLMDIMWCAVQEYVGLAHLYAVRGYKVFNVKNKHHMLYHLCSSAKYINPKVVTCYSYEDLVGRVQRVAMRSTTGLSLLKLSKALMLKYQLCLLNALRKMDK
eukprot:5547877-Alexandrium_andersonii.AAC.1